MLSLNKKLLFCWCYSQRCSWRSGNIHFYTLSLCTVYVEMSLCCINNQSQGKKYSKSPILTQGDTVFWIGFSRAISPNSAVIYLWDSLIWFVCSFCRFQSNRKPQQCEIKVWIIHKYTLKDHKKASVARGLCSVAPLFLSLPALQPVHQPDTLICCGSFFTSQVSRRASKVQIFPTLLRFSVSTTDATACAGLPVRLSYRELGDVSEMY